MVVQIPLVRDSLHSRNAVANSLPYAVDLFHVVERLKARDKKSVFLWLLHKKEFIYLFVTVRAFESLQKIKFSYHFKDKDNWMYYRYVIILHWNRLPTHYRRLFLLQSTVDFD